MFSVCAYVLMTVHARVYSCGWMPKAGARGLFDCSPLCSFGNRVFHWAWSSLIGWDGWPRSSRDSTVSTLALVLGYRCVLSHVYWSDVDAECLNLSLCACVTGTLLTSLSLAPRTNLMSNSHLSSWLFCNYIGVLDSSQTKNSVSWLLNVDTIKCKPYMFRRK